MNTPHDSTSLTARQRAFCEHYARFGNGAAAAIHAGYSARSARQQASRMMTNDDICEHIEHLHSRRQAARDGHTEDMVQQLRQIRRAALKGYNPNLNAALRAMAMEARLLGLTGKDPAAYLPEDMSEEAESEAADSAEETTQAIEDKDELAEEVAGDGEPAHAADGDAAAADGASGDAELDAAIDATLDASDDGAGARALARDAAWVEDLIADAASPPPPVHRSVGGRSRGR
jgi:hypothetical protein